MSYRHRSRISSLGAIALSGVPACLALSPCTAAAQTGSVSDDNGELPEIIVTAQRRQESLQQVPIGVSAVTAQALESAGIGNTRELTQIVPAVQVTRSGPSGLFFIRGVGTTNAAAGEEGANALYIDNVYIGDLGQMFSNFNNVERVEVLKGPQGTLFGRNATGGLIHLITREPGDKAVADLKVGFENYDRVTGQAYLAAPLNDKISADLALTYANQHDGWGQNLTLGTPNQREKYWGARTKLVMRPSDAVKLTLAGDYYKNRDNLGLGWRIADGTVAFGGKLSPGGHDTTSNTPALTRQRIWGVSLTGEADIGFATLTSITARRDSYTHSSIDVDGGPANLLNIDYVSRGKTLQQEVRLASNGTEPLSWQIGFFYLNSKASTDPQQITGALNVQIDALLKTNSYAVFGEATYALSSTTKITGGLRYTWDKRQFDGITRSILTGGALGPVIPASSSSPSNSNLDTNGVSFRVALRQEIVRDVSLYATINRGFKASTFNLQSPGNPPAKPQFIMAYEAGLKTEFFDRRLRLNLSAYHYDIDDLQVRSTAVNGGVFATSLLLNAATAKVDGIDLDFELAATRSLRLFGGATLLNSRYAKFGGPGSPTQAPIVYQAPATCPADRIGSADPGLLTAGPRTGGIVACFGDASGNKLPMSPRFAGSIGATYTLQIPTHGQIHASVLYNYNSGYFFESDNRRKQSHFGILNSTIEYRPAGWIGIEFWGKNITNSSYAVQDLSTAPFVVSEILGAPRTYGVNLNFNF